MKTKTEKPKPNQARHTQGPWEVRPSSNPKNGSGWRDIVSTGEPFSPSYVGEALEQDARLIAAAPDMLQMLQDVGAWLELHLEQGNINAGTANRDGDLVSQISAAIARAEGRE